MDVHGLPAFVRSPAQFVRRFLPCVASRRERVRPLYVSVLPPRHVVPIRTVLVRPCRNDVFVHSPRVLGGRAHGAWGCDNVVAHRL